MYAIQSRKQSLDLMNPSFITSDSFENPTGSMPRDSISTTRATRFPFGSPFGSTFATTATAKAAAVAAAALFASSALFAPAAAHAQGGAARVSSSAANVRPAAGAETGAPRNVTGTATGTATSTATATGTTVVAQAADGGAVDPDDLLMPTTDSQQNLPSVQLNSQIVFQVLAAEIALQRGQAAPAYQTYLSLARDTKDPRMAQRATEIAVNAQSISDALTAARLWHEYAPTSQQASQLDATLLVLNGYLDEARPLLQSQLDSVPQEQRPEAILALQTLVSRGPDKVGGVRVLRGLLSADMTRPEANTAIGRQELLANDVPAARTSFTTALKLKPDYAPAALMLAQMSADDRHTAISMVGAYAKQHPKEHDARFLLAQLYLADNQVDAARKEFDTLHKANANDPAPLFALGLLSLQANNSKDAEKYFTSYADLADKSTANNSSAPGSAAPNANANANAPSVSRIDGGPAYLYLAQIAAARNDAKAADGWLQKVSPISTQYVAAQIARAELLSAQKRYDDALAILSNVRPRTDREALGLGRADAAVLMRAGRYKLAEQHLGALLQLVPDDPDLMYDYAMAAERNGHYKRMEEELRRLIVIQPNNAQAYNALGYSLADRNERLPEADKLVQKALSLAPDDPYITDSAGWVKFRLGDKDQAVTLLKRAYQLQPNAEIGAHLADVLWSQGKQDDARAVLRAAQKLDPTDDTLIETMNRLKVLPQ